MRRTALLIVTVLLLVAACGGDDAPALDEAEQGTATALAASLRGLDDADLVTYLAGSSADMGCWAEALVGSLGADGVTAIGAATSESELIDALAALSGGEQDAAADGLAACVDRDALLKEVTEYLEPDVADCAIGQMFSRSNFRTVFAGFLSGDEDSVAEVEAAVGERCGI